MFTGLGRFDTSSLPDNATVTSVKLRLFVTAKTDANNRNLVGEWYDAGSWPIDAGDWALTIPTSALPGADISAIAAGASNEFTLTNPASVSLTGLTGLRLQVDGGAPSGDNYVQIAALEHTSQPEPQLIVTYTTP